MARFRPFPPVSGAYGAPMGRASANLGLDPDLDRPESLAVAGPAGEYDAGGAYWGLGGSAGPVWAVWRKGKARDGVVYVRARNRDHAKKVALEC
jgi:hypothetical protein